MYLSETQLLLLLMSLNTLFSFLSFVLSFFRGRNQLKLSVSDDKAFNESLSTIVSALPAVGKYVINYLGGKNNAQTQNYVEKERS